MIVFDSMPPNAVLVYAYLQATVSFTIPFFDNRGVFRFSDSKGRVTESTHYVCDRPFLIVVKKRGAKQPFFVMWVDNAELLSKP